MKSHFNVVHLIEGIKACSGTDVTLSFDSKEMLPMCVEPASSDKFVYITAPVNPGEGVQEAETNNE